MKRVWLAVLALCVLALACKPKRYSDYIGPVNAQAIQGQAVSTTPATNGQVLQMSSSSGTGTYVPTTLGSSSGGTPTGTGFRYVASGTENAAAVGLSGDGTIGALSGGNVPLTLSTVNSNTGTFGSGSLIPSITVNAKGLITAVTTNSVVAPLVTWTNVAAAGSLTVSGGSTTTKVTVDSTGSSAATISIPGSGTAVDGQTIIIALRGTSAAAGVTITPGSGAAMEDPNNPGTILAAATGATIRTVGAVFGITYYATGTEWLEER